MGINPKKLLSLYNYPIKYFFSSVILLYLINKSYYSLNFYLVISSII